MNQIIVFRWTKGEILAMYLGPHSAEIERLFGTNTIPTMFHCDSGITDAEEQRRVAMAVATIQANNPSVVVTAR
jgi:hypothetical protein